MSKGAGSSVVEVKAVKLATAEPRGMHFIAKANGIALTIIGDRPTPAIVAGQLRYVKPSDVFRFGHITSCRMP
jgi:hypothetical protein